MRDHNRALAAEGVGDNARRDLSDQYGDFERRSEQHQLQRFEVCIGDEVDQRGEAIPAKGCARQRGPPQEDRDRVTRCHPRDRTSSFHRACTASDVDPSDLVNLDVYFFD